MDGRTELFQLNFMGPITIRNNTFINIKSHGLFNIKLSQQIELKDNFITMCDSDTSSDLPVLRVAVHPALPATLNIDGLHIFNN